MKKIFLSCFVVLSLAACNSSNNNQENNKDTTNYGNAGMTGTMNANGLLPVDSNKTINPSGAAGHATADTTGVDTTKINQDSTQQQ